MSVSVRQVCRHHKLWERYNIPVVIGIPPGESVLPFPHTLRHLLAMHLLQSCVDLATIQSMPGHAA